MTSKLWLAAAVVTATIVTVGVIAWSGAKHAVAGARALPVGTTRVEKRTLSAMVSQGGILSYRARSDGSPYSVINQAHGTYTALPAVAGPAQGGETRFTDQSRAYDTLPADLRTRLAGRTITHVVTGLELSDEDEASAEHPVFRPHPVSGRTALYLTTPARCAALSGMDETEAAEAFELPGADLSHEELTVRVLPRQSDEFTCAGCFLVRHRSQIAEERPNGEAYCFDCAG